MKRPFELLGLFLFFFCNPIFGENCPCEARDVVNQFLQYDFEGYRLSSKGHENIWELTDRNGEPPTYPLSVTKQYRIIGMEGYNKQACRINVEFTIYGTIIEGKNGLVFNREPSNEEWMVIVNCNNGICRISLKRDEFKLPPHAGKNAIARWLSQLEQIRKMPQEKIKDENLRKHTQSLH